MEGLRVENWVEVQEPLFAGSWSEAFTERVLFPDLAGLSRWVARYAGSPATTPRARPTRGTRAN